MFSFFLLQCVQVLLKMGANAFAYKTDDGGNILHFAVECASHFKDTWESSKDTSLCLRELLSTTKLLVNDADDHGMYNANVHVNRFIIINIAVLHSNLSHSRHPMTLTGIVSGQELSLTGIVCHLTIILSIDSF